MVTQIGQNETENVKKEKLISESVSFLTFFISKNQSEQFRTKKYETYFSKNQINKQINKYNFFRRTLDKAAFVNLCR